MDSEVLDIISIGQVIQSAVAPVFLLTGIAALLNVLSNRLSRLIDRARVLEKSLRLSSDESSRKNLRKEQRYVARRVRLVNLAFSLSVACALLISVVVVLLFYSHVNAVNMSKNISFIFIAAMIMLIGALLSLLREIFLASKGVRRGVGMTHIDGD